MTTFRQVQSSTKTRCTSFSENLGFYTNTPILHQSVLKSVQQQKNRIIFSFTPPLRSYSFSGASVFSHSFTWSQWDESYAITADELLPGDLGFLMDSDGQGWNHVLIFAGYGENGERMWVHSSGGEGVILNTPSYEASLSLRRPKNINFEDSSVIPDVE